jgi:hypothetical protein
MEQRIELTPEDWKALNTDYASGEINREHADKYTIVHRGSVRLIRGLYRTEAEQREFIQRGKNVRLPGLGK